MIRIRKYPRILVNLFTVGYIFALYALVYPKMRQYGILILIICAILNVFYVLSDEYKASHLLLSAKKYLEKGLFEKAASQVINASKIQANEEVLLQIHSSPKKNPEVYKRTADLLSKYLKENDTPFLRFAIASFYYTAGNKKKVKELLFEIPEEKRTIKMVRLLGSSLYELKEYDKAIEVFNKYDPPDLPANSDEMAVVFGKGISFLAKGEKEKAVETLSRVEMRNAKYGNVSKIIGELSGEEETDQELEDK